ncbi:MAG: J domain-containing protein [Acidimicrobiales bacterium]
MLLAELEIRHSRAVAPTRRVALGDQWLPTDPAPGYGGVLLGGIVAAHVADVDPDLRAELLNLADDLEAGRRVPQPRLRHRFQVDVVGLDRSLHKLRGTKGEALAFEMDDHAGPVPQLLGAVYAAAAIHPTARPAVFAAIRKAARWEGDLGPGLIAHLSDPASTPPASWRRFPTDERWALRVLGFRPESRPDREDVQRQFRVLLREHHPDHGAESEGAGKRILELTEARRILLPSVGDEEPPTMSSRP